MWGAGLANAPGQGAVSIPNRLILRFYFNIKSNQIKKKIILSTSIDRSKLRININQYPKKDLIHSLVDARLVALPRVQVHEPGLSRGVRAVGAQVEFESKIEARLNSDLSYSFIVSSASF